MPNYRYQSIDNTGRVFRGTIIAFDEANLEQRLSENGLTLVRSKEIREHKLARLPIMGKVKQRALIEFYHRFSQSLEMGLPILSVLDENAKVIPSRPLRKIIEEVKVALENGNTLHEAAERFPDVFSKLDLSIVMMGEQSGVLPQSLKDLADFLEWKEDLRSTVKRATIYPCFIMVTILAVIGVWVGYVLPQMANVLSEMGVVLPALTQAVMSTSFFVQGNWPWLIGATLVLLASAYIFQRTKKVGMIFHKYLLKIPLLGSVLANTAVARLSRNFAQMMKAGMPVNRIFEILVEGTLGNRYLEVQLAVAHQEIQRGQTIAEGFEKADGFPLLLLGAIRNGEISGTLEESFKRLGDYYDNEVKRTVQAMVSAFEPMMILMLGGVFGMIILSILLPLYDVITGAGGAY